MWSVFRRTAAQAQSVGSSILNTSMRRPIPQTGAVMPTLVRGKRTKKAASAPQRVVNMLSVFSAHRKQPRRLKLCKEDLARHQVIQAAWKLFMRNEKAERAERLKHQYLHMEEACDTLQKIDPTLYEAANTREKGKRFSLELRTPTDTPPRVAWQYKWSPPTSKSGRDKS